MITIVDTNLCLWGHIPLSGCN